MYNLLQEHSIKSDTVWDMENEFKHVKTIDYFGGECMFPLSVKP